MFDINNIFITLLNYPISYLELIGTLSGLICVYLAAKNNIHTWTFGIINVIFFFILFYQVHLYSDMILQIYFMYANIVGLIYWTKKKQELTAKSINRLTNTQRLKTIAIILLASAGMGYFMSDVHNLLPTIFPEPASYPYWDSFIAVASIVACWFLAKKKIENWVLWIIIDVICVILYYHKGIMLMSIEYLLFLINATYGLIVWSRLR